MLGSSSTSCTTAAPAEGPLVTVANYCRNCNFGDQLGPVVVKAALERVREASEPLKVAVINLSSADSEATLATATSPVVFACGSLLHRLPSRSDVPAARVLLWGCGCYGDKGTEVALAAAGAATKRAQSVRALRECAPAVLAVRGPLTQEVLTEALGTQRGAAVVLGDPAILLPLFYAPLTVPCACLKQEEFIAVVPHANDADALAAVMAASEVGTAGRRVTMLPSCGQPWQETAAALASAAVVVSSALHPLVVADAYRRPVVWLHDKRLPSARTEARFKFNDWLLGTGRAADQFARSLDEALVHWRELAIEQVTEAGLASQQEALLAALRDAL